MSPLWTHEDASAASGGTAHGVWSAQGVSIDSRTVKTEDLFVAIKGPNSDGHDYVATALAAGAAAAMVSERRTDWPDDAPLLLVENTDAGLAALGHGARKRIGENACIIGVTGSVGKTGTKEALRHCLAEQAPTTATEGNLNNQWGLPLSLARMPAATVYGIFELGMNHAGEISALSKILQPDIAIITTVEPVHTEFFDSVEGIADAKAEIFDGMNPDGVAILNRDNAYFDRLIGHAETRELSKIISFGSDPS
ncbi:MAG TPA: UDP-N-acetylmuramoylalanyl-D-glutamyl-2, 6-diaminopimelate--D-alanyl-D-alanine ligase, partial [Rhodospirillaceae bacterium]|nr:UDP-N-acetylmuramoylalanyl-D-glutamyl-2, 6-diaminopimelate--D-alanyl-D-alanine ligase [Rhodospirillaceae bacterium]